MLGRGKRWQTLPMEISFTFAMLKRILFTFAICFLFSCGPVHPKYQEKPVVIDAQFTGPQLAAIISAHQRWCNVLNIDPCHRAISDDLRRISVMYRPGESTIPAGPDSHALAVLGASGIIIWADSFFPEDMEAVALHEFGHFYGGEGHQPDNWALLLYLPEEPTCINSADLASVCLERECTGEEVPECDFDPSNR